MKNTETNKKITEFFGTDYVNFSSYDNLRKIASLTDGQKNAARKILYTILQKNIKEKIKVSQLGSKVSEFAEYLHGNMDNVIVNLSQDYTGTNNLPLLQKKGNFGTRFAQEASASRYIFTYGSDKLFKLFNKDDIQVLTKQYFEGREIEPMFYVPNLPVLVINGSEGVSSGFAQKILPRSVEDVKKYILDYMDGGKTKQLIPYYNNFKGIIEQGETPNQWLIKGCFSKISGSKIEITEVPIGYDLKGYLSVLDDLEEKKIIKSYKDKSEDDNFRFEVTMGPSDLSKLSDDDILNKFKLIKKVSENYTVMSEENKIKVFNNIYEVIEAYIKIKLEYLNKRKDYQLSKLNEEIRYDLSKYTFIKNIVENKLIINKRKKIDIEKDLESIENIIKKDDSFDYLLNMNILSLTEERMNKLLEDIKIKKFDLDKLKETDIKDIWKDEIKNIS